MQFYQQVTYYTVSTAGNLHVYKIFKISIKIYGRCKLNLKLDIYLS